MEKGRWQQMSERLRPAVEIDFDGQEGNIFFVIAKVTQVLDYMGDRDDSKQMVEEIKQAGSYDSALEIVSKYARLIPTSGDAQLRALLRKFEEQYK